MNIYKPSTPAELASLLAQGIPRGLIYTPSECRIMADLKRENPQSARDTMEVKREFNGAILSSAKR